jgi:hypothetical protein
MSRVTWHLVLKSWNGFVKLVESAIGTIALLKAGTPPDSLT